MKAYSISYERNSVMQSINIIADTAEQAEQFFKDYEHDAIIFGSTEISERQLDADSNKGKPMLIARCTNK